MKLYEIRYEVHTASGKTIDRAQVFDDVEEAFAFMDACEKIGQTPRMATLDDED